MCRAEIALKQAHWGSPTCVRSFALAASPPSAGLVAGQDQGSSLRQLQRLPTPHRLVETATVAGGKRRDEMTWSGDGLASFSQNVPCPRQVTVTGRSENGNNAIFMPHRVFCPSTDCEADVAPETILNVQQQCQL
ncbi:unnamed protein product [Protopolystoma xenopodis]|uniref:Uncharacterized protein n=1 Tax=Protopolystoma xenopodis TaxID=117903 RepID=A0A448XQE4_9PLAT|nr:unnamed protein product [Protopolystoma xenopodis]